MSVSMTAKVWQLALDPTSKMVLLRLADFVNREGTTAWPSVELLAHECCINRRTIQRSLRKLTELGLITPEDRVKGYRSVVYALHPDRGVKLPPFVSQKGAALDTAEGRLSRQRGAAMATERGGAVPPKPGRTGKMNRKTEPRPPNPPLSRGAQRAKAGSRRQRDVEALTDETGESVYFQGKYGRVLKERLEGEAS